MVFFGHRDADAVSRMTTLTVRGSGSAAANATLRTLRLSARHFVPTLAAAGRFHHKYARDVAPGDRVLLLSSDGSHTEGVVVDKGSELAFGLLNPYTKARLGRDPAVVPAMHSGLAVGQDAGAPAVR